MAADSTASSHCGTLFYMAPEIFKGRYTRSVDWWALGVTIYKLLTGDVSIHLWKKLGNRWHRFPQIHFLSTFCLLAQKCRQRKGRSSDFCSVFQMFRQPRHRRNPLYALIGQ
ncbi:hypothetical protein XENTR_v10003496 [Xenopus tropicalis]|nr:hypothetical protein XENTR_v10003496 [Xenopus tropicalis]